MYAPAKPRQIYVLKILICVISRQEGLSYYLSSYVALHRQVLIYALLFEE